LKNRRSKATPAARILSETMGRTSKFSFPIPGRKQSSSKESTTSKSSRTSNQPLSKAQRILGTENDLNIDSPTADAYAFGFPSPKPSRMSISISESTNESGSVHGSQSEQWDRESGVFPRSQRLPGKASSTVLGQRYRDDGVTDISSQRLQHEDSSSTLRSHYDRLKSPLSISQQTSESSARDLALRKGFPPVVQRSPLLQVDSTDPFDNQFSKAKGRTGDNRYQGEFSRDRDSKKKPAKLDLSMLFPSRKRESKSSDRSSLVPSEASLSTRGSRTPRTSGDPGHRKLSKVPSKESLQSKQSIRSSQSYDPKKRSSALTSGTGGTLYQLYDHYEQMPVRSPRMDRIPESNVPERIASRTQAGGSHPTPEPPSRQRKDRESVRSPQEGQAFSWKNVRSSMVSPRNEASSAASISSRNTKTSWHTSGSAISNSDLKVNSVLSLSSDSEGEAAEVKSPTVSSKSKASRGSSHTVNDNQRHTRELSSGLTPRSHSSRNSSRKTPGQESHVYSIPETSATDGHSSRRAIKEEPPRSSNHGKEPRHLTQKEKRSSRKPSVTSARSLQPTPPLSPTSSETQESSDKSSRLMAVTKQEEQLLEALRLKRARMREEIIEEHVAKSPPRVPEKSRARHSKESSNAVQSSERQRILLYLDTPISDTHQIDMAEPSPDLSDFLSFGSDEDSTPRTSWAPPPKSQARPDSTTRSRRSRISPITPPSAARLSAVGAPLPSFSDDEPAEPVIGARKRVPGAGVRFVEEAKIVYSQDYLLDDDDDEDGVIWGMN